MFISKLHAFIARMSSVQLCAHIYGVICIYVPVSIWCNKDLKFWIVSTTPVWIYRYCMKLEISPIGTYQSVLSTTSSLCYILIFYWSAYRLRFSGLQKECSKTCYVCKPIIKSLLTLANAQCMFREKVASLMKTTVIYLK